MLDLLAAACSGTELVLTPRQSQASSSLLCNRPNTNSLLAMTRRTILSHITSCISQQRCSSKNRSWWYPRCPKLPFYPSGHRDSRRPTNRSLIPKARGCRHVTQCTWSLAQFNELFLWVSSLRIVFTFQNAIWSLFSFWLLWPAFGKLLISSTDV